MSPELRVDGTYYVSVAHWFVVIHDSTSAQHMSRPVSFDCRTTRHKHHSVTESWVIICEQASGCPGVSFSRDVQFEFVSLSKTSVSGSRADILSQHLITTGRVRRSDRTHFPRHLGTSDLVDAVSTGVWKKPGIFFSTEDVVDLEGFKGTGVRSRRHQI